MITLADKGQWHANASQPERGCLVEIQDYVYFISRLTCFTCNDTRARSTKLREKALEAISNILARVSQYLKKWNKKEKFILFNTDMCCLTLSDAK